MGYFDDPKHREQWEKELSELRQEKARVKAGLPPVSDKAEHSVSRNMEKAVPENDFVSEERFDKLPRETAFSHDIPEKQAKAGAEKTAVPEEIKPEKADIEERTIPRRSAAERAGSGEPHRVKITFDELLRRENMYTPPKLTKKPRSLERQKEVSHEL